MRFIALHYVLLAFEHSRLCARVNTPPPPSLKLTENKPNGPYGDHKTQIVNGKFIEPIKDTPLKSDKPLKRVWDFRNPLIKMKGETFFTRLI